jgi:hypothetical protein
MRKLLAVALAGVFATMAIGLASAPAAKAGCQTIRCLNKQDAKLKRQVRTLRRRVRTIFTCLKAVPVTQYGDPEQDAGYLFDSDTGDPTEPFPTTALDITTDGDQIHAWFVIDNCQTQTVARASVSRTLGGGLLQPLLGFDPEGESK